MAKPISTLTRVQKVAIFLTALGAEGAGNVLRHFPENQAVGILQEIADLHTLDEARVRAVLDEFQANTEAALQLRMGPDYAALLIQKTFGKEHARRIMDRVDRQLNPPPFFQLSDMSGADLAHLLVDESEQIGALVLAFLPPETAAEVLPHWPLARQTEISRRILAMDTHPDPEFYQVERGLLKKRAEIGETTQPGSAKALADILANVNDAAAERILQALASERPDLADDLRAQFVSFSDVQHLTDQGVQLLLSRIPLETWGMALKGAAAGIQGNVERNLSTRARERLVGTMEQLGPQPRRLVDAARAEIVDSMKAAERSGDLMVRRGADQFLP